MEYTIENGILKNIKIYNKNISTNVPVEEKDFYPSFIANPMALKVKEDSLSVKVKTGDNTFISYNKDGTEQYTETLPVVTSYLFDFDHSNVEFSESNTFDTVLTRLSGKLGYMRGKSPYDTSALQVAVNTMNGSINENGTITGKVEISFNVQKYDIVFLDASNYAHLLYDTSKQVTKQYNVYPIVNDGVFKIISTDNAKIEKIALQKVVLNG